MCISLYTTRVVLNTLGITDYGIYNVVCGFVALFSFLNTSMSNGIQRFYNFEAGKNGIDAVTKVYQTSLLIQLLLVVFILLVIEPLGVWYINNKMVIPAERIIAANWVFQCSLLSLALLVMQVPFSAAIMAHERIDYFATVGIIDAILKLAIIIILPFLGYDKLIVYGLLVLFVSVINVLLYSVYALKRFSELKTKIVLHKELFGSIFKFTGWNLVEMFAWTTQGQGVNMVLNLFCGPIVNAAQGVANQVNSALNSFCTNLSVAFRPQLVQSYAEGNYTRALKMSYIMSKTMFGMMCIMIFPLIAELPNILSLWIGTNVPDYTISFTTLILLSMLPRNLTTALSQIVHATGKMKTYQIGSAMIVLLVLPISYFLLHIGLEPYYIYIANILIYILLLIVDLILLHRVFLFSYTEYVKEVALPCVSILITVPIVPFCISHFSDPSMWRLILNVVVSIVVSLILIYYLLLNNEEKSFFTNTLKAKFKTRII